MDCRKSCNADLTSPLYRAYLIAGIGGWLSDTSRFGTDVSFRESFGRAEIPIWCPPRFANRTGPCGRSLPYPHNSDIGGK